MQVLQNVPTLCLFHDEMRVAILNNGYISLFAVKTDEKQGWMVASTLFLTFLASLLRLNRDKLPDGLQLTTGMDSKLFTLRWIQSQTKTLPTPVTELQYAGDAAANAVLEMEIQRIIDVFTEVFEKMALTLNIQIAKAYHQ